MLTHVEIEFLKCVVECVSTKCARELLSADVEMLALFSASNACRLCWSNNVVAKLKNLLINDNQVIFNKSSANLYVKVAS